ncbi:MAG TPA: hypothetical protein VIE19_09085 [Lapillicoccus sp.]|jgi:hypothetical protein
MTMPMRFGLTPDQLVRDNVDTALTFLWSSLGVDQVSDLKLKSSGTHLIVPDDATLLLMGITSELTAELGAVKTAGADRFANESQKDGMAFMLKFAARRRTTKGGKPSLNMPEVTLIALHAGAAKFDTSWTQFGRATPHVKIDDLVAELPLIKARG